MKQARQNTKIRRQARNTQMKQARQNNKKHKNE
jgi:hypothetical protein